MLGLNGSVFLSKGGMKMGGFIAGSSESSNGYNNSSTERIDGSLITRFYRSFSGTDALVFIMLPQTEPLLLGSLSTISYSMMRDKKPVPIIGQVNVGGFTRGMRIYAGTMIFTMINQHWISDLREHVSWLRNLNVTKVDELPLFDLMIVCANEYGAAMQMFIYGVDLTDEGQILSVEDILTENTFSFVARDITNFSNEFKTQDGIVKIQPVVKRHQFKIQKPKAQTDLRLTMDFNSSNMVSGLEVASVQKLLNQHLKARNPLPITGYYDLETYQAVKSFQSARGLTVTGSLDDETYRQLQHVNADDVKEKTAVVSSIFGAPVYQTPSLLGKIVYRYSYLEHITFHPTESDDWVEVDRGYIHADDLESYLTDYQHSFTTIHPQTKELSLIEAIQLCFSHLKNADLEVTGVWDEQTMDFVAQYQKDRYLPVTGFMDEMTWKCMKQDGILTLDDELAYRQMASVSFEQAPSSYQTTLENKKSASYYFLSPFEKQPGRYYLNGAASGLTSKTSRSDLEQYGVTIQSGNRSIAVTISAISHFPNGSCRCFTSYESMATFDRRRFALMDYPEALLYDLEYQAEPNKVEFMVSVDNGETYKWKIDIQSSKEVE